MTRTPSFNPGRVSRDSKYPLLIYLFLVWTVVKQLKWKRDLCLLKPDLNLSKEISYGNVTTNQWGLTSHTFESTLALPPLPETLGTTDPHSTESLLRLDSVVPRVTINRPVGEWNSATIFKTVTVDSTSTNEVKTEINEKIRGVGVIWHSEHSCLWNR